MMPTPRRRALSISRELQSNQLTVAQSQSTFINKLPLEIRRMIYEKALGEQPIHTTVSDGKLIARRCGLRNCTCYLRPCPPGQRLHLALPLLRTCRQIYSEAVEYLYRANEFFISTDLEDFPTAGYLSYFFQSQRIAQIGNLNIEWDLDRHQYFNVNLMPDHHRREWYRSWDGLSNMTGLRRLHIKFYFCLDLWQGCYGEFWEQNNKELLQPIKKITAPRDFLITLPNWQCSTNIDVGESRCTFKLPERVDLEGNAS
ncbi:hypothetical protein J4E82_002581 [Alternaria postmessia]|uniref:uncharacterized protein n=1 Tax=Alternaria postmessia TaxID=1187938 RepID=UPI002224F4FF|nr:uncharacterized protein J4E82_002581 [Alternaria postmessia]KAI5378695.1 hypothetical protein J4E82_002581 [Alternaria postmessia]